MRFITLNHINDLATVFDTHTRGATAKPRKALCTQHLMCCFLLSGIITICRILLLHDNMCLAMQNTMFPHRVLEYDVKFSKNTCDEQLESESGYFEFDTHKFKSCIITHEY